MEDVQAKLKLLERRDWGLWVTAMLVMALLALGFALVVFAIPAEQSPVPLSQVWTAAAGLLVLIVLFGGYISFQQKQIKGLRYDLAEQVAEGNRLQLQTVELQRLALLDAPTGLYTRQFLEQHLETEVARSVRYGHSLNGLIVSLTQFEQVAARYGASGTEALVQEFAIRLKRSIRTSDIPVRVKPDEFLVVLTESSIERVPHILARLSGLEIEIGGEPVAVALAAGWAAYQKGEEARQFLERLEWELAEDKRTGASLEAIRLAQADIRRTQDFEALGRLAGKLAHDFNNLLNLVKGYSELVLDSVRKGDPIREYVEQIHEANEMANSMTRQLMAFTRTNIAKPESLDLNSVVGDMRVMLQRLMGSGIEVVTQCDDDLGRITGVRGQVEQVLLNLAVHARDMMPNGGRFLLETSNVELDDAYAHWHPGARPGAYVLLSVRDNGNGVDADTLAHIFEPFSAPKKKGRKGEGLGLAAVYGIVKQSGGYIAAESTPGRGTAFEVYWPRVAEAVTVS